MKKVMLSWVIGWLFVACQHQPQWQLMWEESFDGKVLDTTVWSMIPQGHFEKSILCPMTNDVMRCVMVY